MTRTSVAVLPDELIPEILSFLPVNSLLRFRSVCKSWKTLISDSSFVKLHLKKSQTRRNPLFTIITLISHRSSLGGISLDYSFVPYSLNRLIENPPFTLSVDPYYHVRNKECNRIVGTCNGLILLDGNSEQLIQYFRVWNPATRTISPNFGHLSCYRLNPPDPSIAFRGGYYRFYFCCDDSTDTYNIVASGVRSGREGTHVRILSLGHNVWRDIQSGPVPRHMEHDDDGNDAVHLCSTVNWLAMIGDGYDLTVDQFVISSLDLKTETFNQYSLPTAFDEVPPATPIVAALGGFLSFSYFYKKTDYVIWQMKELGVEASWTQFLKINLQNLQIDYNYYTPSVYDDDSFVHFQLVPMLLSKDADTLVLKSNQESHAILYNWRDIRVERTKITTNSTISNNIIRNSICWHSAKNFVESLVSTF